MNDVLPPDVMQGAMLRGNEYGCVGSGNSEPLIPEILSRSALEGETSSKFK
jgi:hypothetical protein